MKRYMLSILPLFLCLPLAAQQTYHAQVVDGETGEALPYAQVYVSAGNGTLTDGEGWFTLEAKKTDVVRISYVGYDAVQVKTAAMGDRIQLHPLSATMQEVTIVPAEEVLEKMLRRIDKEFLREENKRSNYFYRLTNTYAGTQELVEAYLNAYSMGNLRDVVCTAGRRLKHAQYTIRRSGISFSNLQKIIETGPVMRDAAAWENIGKPFNPVLNITDTATGEKWGNSNLDKVHYTFSGQLLETSDGKGVYKITMRGNMEKSFIDGVVYVDAKRYQLLSFEGELHNFKLEVGKDLRHESADIRPKVRITYSHRHGFTEVESIVATMDVGNLQSRSVLMSLDGYRLPFGEKEFKQTHNLVEAIDQTSPDTALWRTANIRRTKAEEQLVLQQGLKRSDLRDWEYAMRDDTHDNTGSLQPYIERLTAFGRTIPQEKVYVHMDNTCYFQGDTIWFAAYTRQTTDDRPSRVSGVLYVELLNQDGYLVERKLIEMHEGRGNGFFALNNQIQYSGFYELRAYTRWQLNWGTYEMEDKKMVYRTALERVQQKIQNFHYEKLYSRVFPVYDKPSTPGDFSHVITERSLRRYYSKDVNAEFRKPTLTLFPEGGNLVAGIPNRVAFEAVTVDGEWLEGTATHPSSTEGEVIKTVNRGRGVFTIVPERGMEREVTFTTEDGQTVKARLPKPEERGVTLSVTENGKELKIQATANDSALASHLGMTIMHEGRVEEFLTFRDSVLTFDFVPAIYRPGVHQVTVFDDEGRVWADRLFFSRGKETFQPNITIKADKEQYDPQQPIILDVKGNAGDAAVSLAVRDKANQDYLFDNASILTEMLLSSEIRGFVPDPGWFFEADDSLHRAALDLLMMTQGWRRFNWRDMAVRGEWDLTQPDEQTPILRGQVDKYWYPDPYDTEDFEEEDDRAAAMRQEYGDIFDPQNSGEIGHSQQAMKQNMMSLQSADKHQRTTQERFSPRYGLERTIRKRDGKYKELRVHAELVSPDGKEALVGEMETFGSKFRIQLPAFYGKAIFFIGAADTTKWKEGMRYTWVQQKQDDEDRPAGFRNGLRFYVDDPEYIVRLRFHYPRNVDPYNFYQKHLSASPDTLELTPHLLADGTRVMGEVSVHARHGGLRRHDDSQPVLVVDAYEAFNRIIDDYYTCGDYAARDPIGKNGAMTRQAQRVRNLSELESYMTGSYLGSTGIWGHVSEYNPVRYGPGPTRRAIIDKYQKIPLDSLYAPKYLSSAVYEMSPGEMWEFDNLKKLDRFYIYTDFAPRLYGDKRYSGGNAPERIIAVYPYFDGRQRPEYRDRRYVLEGFARPAEFYSPNYSRYKLPEGQKDYRRTLYWNPNLQLDSDGRARVTLYNNSRTTQIEVEAAGQAADGTLLWNR